MPEISDTNVLVDKAVQGDEQAFTRLVHAWYKRIFNFNYKYFFDHDLAMEVTQKTFISAYSNLRKLKNKHSFSGWLYAIAVNHCREEDRRQNRRWAVSFNAMKKKDEGFAPADPGYLYEGTYNPEVCFQKEELSAILLKALTRIPAEQKVVLIMKEYEGLKFREIAESLKISENTAKSRLYYGLKALRKILENWKIDKEEIYYGS